VAGPSAMTCQSERSNRHTDGRLKERVRAARVACFNEKFDLP
jgi:hypothetical protein